MLELSNAVDMLVPYTTAQKKQWLLIHIKENIHVEFWLFQPENVAYGVSIVEIDPTNISVIVIKRQQESIEQLFMRKK